MEFKEYIKEKPRFWIYIILALFVIMEIAGHVLFNYRKKQTETQTYHDLSTINTIKIERLEGWFNERRSDGEVLQGDAFLLEAIKHWLFNPVKEDPVLKKKLLDYFETLESSYGYSGIFLFDTRLNLLLSTSAGGKLSEYASTLALETIGTKEIMLSDLHIGRQTDTHIDLMVPLMDATASPNKEVIGILIIKLDPAYFLYPLITSWPSMSPSSESVLVRREADSVIFLNKPRFFSGQSTNLKIPLASTSVPAVRAVTGYEGNFTGTDYLGHRVFSNIRSIPGTNWYIISKVDRREVLYPVYERFIASNAFTVLVILIVSFAFYGSWSRQQARHAKERQALLQRFEYLIKYANDIFILTDRDNKIIDVNEAAIREYGYGRDEFLTLTMNNIQSPDHIGDLEREMTAIAGNMPARIETWRSDYSRSV
jgi:PAS domain-containing protein